MESEFLSDREPHVVVAFVDKDQAKAQILCRVARSPSSDCDTCHLLEHAVRLSHKVLRKSRQEVAVSAEMANKRINGGGIDSGVARLVDERLDNAYLIRRSGI